MATYTQDTRLIGIETPLGKDVLLLRGFNGQESVSQLPAFELDLLSIDPEIKFEEIIGKRVTLRVTLAQDKNRYFNGFISRFVQTGAQSGMANYRATMVPWLWFLTKTTDCRIFQNKTIPDIIQQICKEYGFTDINTKLQATYEPRDYCVQYRETDYNFVARLMEQYGIFYFFEHENEKHTLVLADNPDAHQPCPEQSAAKWNPQGSKSLTEDVVTTLEVEKIFRPGKYALTDYNFETPSTSLLSEIETTIAVGENTKYEVYDYPGEYEKKAQGKMLVKVRMEEQEAKHYVVTGTSSCRAFSTGYRFDFEDYSRADLNQAYVLTTVSHAATVGDTYTTGKTGDGTEAYRNTFTCIPHTVPFRPPQITPKPIVQGIQTAVVVGPSGEKIWPDKFARVKVQFHWDREGRRDDKSSCWIRVSQPWGGKGWGGVFIPHVGQEVIVNFEEGDPDRPIISGRLYNAEVMPPLNLPADKTKSMMKDHGGCEITMEGEAGKQQVKIGSPTKGSFITIGAANSPEGFNLGSEAHMNRELGGNDLLKAAGNQLAEIVGNITKSAGGSDTSTIGGSKKTMVAGSGSSFIGGKDTTVIGGKSGLNVGGKRTETIGGAHTISNPKMTTNVGGKCVVKAGGSLTEQSPKINLNGGSKINAKSGGPINVKAGGAINQQASAKINVKAGGTLNQQASTINIKGPTNVKGATKIKGATAINGATTVEGETSIKGATKFKGDHKVTGTSKFNGNTLKVS